MEKDKMIYGKDEIDTTSRENVKKNGEVFTPFATVEQMQSLFPDAVWADPSYIFIEPTSGNGQFLVKIFEKRIKHGIDIETALNTMLGMEINKETLIMSHFRLYERVCAQMMVIGIKPMSKQWKENAIRYVSIVRNNIFCVKDSLKVMADYGKGKGKIAEKKFVFIDPTGNGEIMNIKAREKHLANVTKELKECKLGVEKKTLSPFFKKA